MENTLLIIDKIYKEDKSGLHYILQMLDHKKWWHTSIEFHTKDVLRYELMTIAVNSPDLFLQCYSYKKALEKLNKN